MNKRESPFWLLCFSHITLLSWYSTNPLVCRLQGRKEEEVQEVLSYYYQGNQDPYIIVVLTQLWSYTAVMLLLYIFSFDVIILRGCDIIILNSCDIIILCSCDITNHHSKQLWYHHSLQLWYHHSIQLWYHPMQLFSSIDTTELATASLYKLAVNQLWISAPSYFYMLWYHRPTKYAVAAASYFNLHHINDVTTI